MSAAHDTEVWLWLNQAAADLAAARALQRDSDEHASHVCVLSQQSVEKHFKAVLASEGRTIPRIHGLVELKTHVGGKLTLALGDEELEWLTMWITVGRYPGDWVAAAPADAVRALDVAERMMEVVLESLRLERGGCV